MNEPMINEPHYFLPGENGFKGQILDDLLALGYYRMQHLIFTTHYTALDPVIENIPVFWLRTEVKKIHENKAAFAIRKRCSLFTVTIKKAEITTELEKLYSIYKNHVDFSASATCWDYLHLDEFENPYDSWMIEIRDGNILIAAGFFDKGENAITGILNFYHPAYHKFSLGKYLILKKIDHAVANNILYYYTGYISTAITKFDYKLFPDIKAIEVYLPVENIWTAYDLLGKDKLKDYIMNDHLNGKIQ